MHLLAVVGISVALSAGMSQAQTVNGNFVHEQVGSYSAGVVCSPVLLGQLPAPDTIEGRTNEIGGDVRFSSAVREVPAMLGMSFGVSAGSVDEDFPFVTMTIEHPPMGDAGVTHQSWLTEVQQGTERVTLFSFQHDYELVQGRWTFTARSGDEVLYRADFEVVPPAEAPELAQMCGVAMFLS